MLRFSTGNKLAAARSPSVATHGPRAFVTGAVVPCVQQIGPHQSQLGLCHARGATLRLCCL
jgi:hypothetical protein